MIIYHGSTALVEKPEIRISDTFLDFGTGFYTTTWSCRISGLFILQRCFPLLNLLNQKKSDRRNDDGTRTIYCHYAVY
jgi:hypothetical protein